MSGGFFRGTSADQDTRFSNKTAKLLKTQKFAPELDQLVDMGKIKMDVMRPWIATRVTQFLGFEDEVLINFIYELLEGKNVDGKQIQIQLTGFMEKNTGKFMKELWGLLTSAQNSKSGIPQQFLDEKAEEAGKKKAEELRVIPEIQRREEEKKNAELEVVKKEDLPMAGDNVAGSAVAKRRSNSPSRGGKSPDVDHAEARNGSPRPVSRQRSVSHSPRLRRSRSPPRRGRSPHYRRSRSPVRRARSPNNHRSPRRRRRSPAYSRSPRGRSPIAAPRSPRRRRSPPLSYSPRGRSPVTYSPRRRRSPAYGRSPPRRRKSPPRSPPRYRRRSPRYGHSPPRRHPPASPPPRRHHSPHRHTDVLPRRRALPESPQHSFPSPRLRARSLSPEASSKSPPQLQDSSRSPSRSPPQSISPRRRKSPQEPPPRGRPLRRSMSPPQQHRLPSYQRHGVRSPSPVVHTVKQALTSQNAGSLIESPTRGKHHAVPVQHRRTSPSLSSRRRGRSVSSSENSPPNGKSGARSPPTRGLIKERMDSSLKSERNQKIFESMPTSSTLRKRTRSSSTESSLPDEDRQAAALKKPTVLDARVEDFPTVNRQPRKVEEPTHSVSSDNDDQQYSPAVNWRNTKDIESDGEENRGTTLPVIIDDRKAAKRRRREERRLRKEEKRRKREERHKRKEEKRASKALSKGVAFVTPPPDFDKRTIRSDDFDSADEGKEDDMEMEQRRIENELRRKALDSIKAKKGVSS